MTAPGCIGCEWVNACHNHELACDAFEHWHQREAVDNALPRVPTHELWGLIFWPTDPLEGRGKWFYPPSQSRQRSNLRQTHRRKVAKALIQEAA